MSLMPFEEAYRRLIASEAPINRVDEVPLARSLGRVLASDVVASRTQPSFDASAMDGYAVRADDCGGSAAPLRVIGESAAGTAYEGRLDPRTCVRIFTGAPMPPGADAVLIQEDARHEPEGRIAATTVVEKGQHVRPAGTDFSAGDCLVAKGCELTPGRIALAASGGRPVLEVVARPRVAILANGDELVLPGEAVGPAQIVSSNSYGVAATVEKAGGLAIDCGIARDSKIEIAGKIETAIEDGVDILVTIGGASVGDHDLIAAVLQDRGVDLAFWKVAMRPGKPLMAGRFGNTRVLGLPGNPASALVTAELFLAPLVRRLAGLPHEIAFRDGILAEDVPANGERMHFMRAALEERADGPPLVHALPRQDSSLLSVYASAEALLVRPAHAAQAEAGDGCRFIRLF